MNSQKLEALVCLYLMLLMSPVSFAQQKTSLAKPFNFKKINVDPIVSIKNTTAIIQQGVSIYYRINGDDLLRFDYGCPIAASATIQVALPRATGDNLLSFEGWIVPIGEEKSNGDDIILDGASFLLSPIPELQKLKIASVPVVIFPAPETPSVKARLAKAPFQLLVSTFINDRNKFSAYASVDKGKYWIKGVWKKIAGAEERTNEVTFSDKNSDTRSFRLLVSTKSVDENDVSKFQGIGNIASPAACTEKEKEPEAYPNPFLNKLTINYSLIVPGDVHIHIVNAQGQVVAKVLEGVHKEKGTHTCYYDGTMLSSGTYYCVIKYGKIEKTLKLVKSK